MAVGKNSSLKGFAEAHLKRVLAENAMAKARTDSSLSQWLDGFKGPKGERGEPGPPGRDRYMLTYCGVHFLVELLPSTFDMIEDATNVNGDELAFIKVINEDEWKRIRGAWAHKWQQNKAFEAFERGDFCDDFA